jgi:hypothetical protein
VWNLDALKHVLHEAQLGVKHSEAQRKRPNVRHEARASGHPRCAKCHRATDLYYPVYSDYTGKKLMRILDWYYRTWTREFPPLPDSTDSGVAAADPGGSIPRAVWLHAFEELKRDKEWLYNELVWNSNFTCHFPGFAASGPGFPGYAPSAVPEPVQQALETREGARSPGMERVEAVVQRRIEQANQVTHKQGMDNQNRGSNGQWQRGRSQGWWHNN